MLMVKLQQPLTDNLFIGALAAKRSNDSRPTIFTDAKGKILGFNQLVDLY